MNTEPTPSCPQCGAILPPGTPDNLCPRCLMAMNLQTETAVSGEAPAAQPPLPPAAIAPYFPQLEILVCLGRGGMGVVYQARQKTLNRFVALKLLAPERVGDPVFAERFTREAQALAALNHPNIVTIHDFGQAGGYYFLLMEFVDGLNLRQLLRTRQFTPEEALAIVPVLCDALQFAHERGIVHRDIKPENILLDKSGRVKVADFGIAKILGTSADPAGPATAAPAPVTASIVGTPGYRAPEQSAQPQRVDSRADIYSLGVVFYEMLTGELPGQKIAPPSAKVQIDVRLDEIVLRALAQKPELRYQQASDLKSQVQTLSSPASPPPPVRPAKTPIVQAFESYFGFTWTSRTAIIVGNFSNLGFLGVMGMLSEIPGWEWFRGAYGFCGFFGLLGFACLIEWPKLKKADRAPTGAPPQFSRTALLGACCFGVTFCLGWSGLTPRVRVNQELAAQVPSASPLSVWAGALDGRLPVLELIFVLSATLLGWVAVSQIRRSAGKIYGMSLALFEGLLFPLLALDALIFFLGSLVAIAIHGDPELTNQNRAILMAATILLSLMMDVFIICAVWRAVKPPLKSAATPALGTPQPAPAPPKNMERRPPPPVGQRNFIPLLRWRDRWIWDTSYVTLMAFVPAMVSAFATPLLILFFGQLGWLALIPGGMGWLFAAVYGWVGHRVRQLKAQLPKTNAEVAEALLFERPRQTPGIAVLHPDRVELFGIALIKHLVIPLDTIATLSEVRMFNGRRLWWKRGFVLDLKNGQRIGLAVPQTFGRRWRAILSGGSLPELPDPPAGPAENERLRPRATWRQRFRKFFGFTLPVAVVVALILRTFFLQAFWLPTNSCAPEIPRGSLVLVWKPSHAFAPGDLIAYRFADLVYLGRVANRAPAGSLMVERNGESAHPVPPQDIIGPVVSIIWRESGTAMSSAPAATTHLSAVPSALTEDDSPATLQSILTDFPDGFWAKPLLGYARDRRPDNWFTLVSLDRTDDVSVNPTQLGLPAATAGEQVAATAGQGDFYIPDIDHLAPVRGTKIAPLRIKPHPTGSNPEAAAPDPNAARAWLDYSTRREIANAIIAYDAAHTNGPWTRDAKWVRLTEGSYYGALRPDGLIVVLAAIGHDDDQRSLQFIPLGKLGKTVPSH